jgi:hypothetical protein
MVEVVATAVEATSMAVAVDTTAADRAGASMAAGMVVAADATNSQSLIPSSTGLATS